MSTYQLGVANQLPSKPEEGLLEVVVGLGRDIVVLEVLLAVESDGLGLHLTLLNVDLVTSEDNRDTLADTDEITWQGRRECQQLNEQQGRCGACPQVRSKTYGASWGRSCR